MTSSHLTPLTETYYLATYYSPGTLFAESSSHEFKTLDLPAMVHHAKKVSERHGATPYCFTITEMKRPVEKGEFDVVPKEVRRHGGRYYLTGTLSRYDDIPDTDEFSILRANARGNDWPVFIENTNSYRTTQAFKDYWTRK